MFAFHAHSRHRCYYVHDPARLEPDFDFDRFDVVLLFWSNYLLGPVLSATSRERIRESRALKLLFLQDEYRDVRKFNAVMADLGVNVMFTCVAEKDHELFYPRGSIPSLRATYTVLTGYVPDELVGRPPDLETPRPIDIGYRARELPCYLGDLGLEKLTIATRFAQFSRERGFTSDISAREADRIYGPAWPRFLRSCRHTLGTESGASLIDFTGEIRQRCDAYLAEHPDTSYAEMKRRFFADVDWRHSICAISPRVFEAAALGTALILHEGTYSGVLTPGEHFIMVRKDYANLDDVESRMRDAAYCRAMARRTYLDVIASERWGYPRFVRWFDGVLDTHLERPLRRWNVTRPAFYVDRWYRADQVMVPWGTGYRTVPTRRQIADRVAAAVERLRDSMRQRVRSIRALIGTIRPRIRFDPPDLLGAAQRRLIDGAPTLVRFWQDPRRYVWKSAVVLTVLAREQSLRALFVRLWLQAPSRERPILADLSEDLVKLAILIRWARTLQTVIRVEPRLDGARLTIVAENTSQQPVTAAAARRALSEGSVDGLEWDNSRLGPYVHYPLGALRPVEFHVGDEARHCFTILERAVRTCPDEVLRAMNPLLP